MTPKTINSIENKNIRSSSNEGCIEILIKEFITKWEWSKSILRSTPFLLFLSAVKENIAFPNE